MQWNLSLIDFVISDMITGNDKPNLVSENFDSKPPDILSTDECALKFPDEFWLV